MLSLDRVAPLLETAIEKLSSNNNIIKNGFKACGLYPWNPNAIDYTKCLGSKQTEEIQNINYPPDTATITFKNFRNIVGNNIFKKLETFNNQSSKAQNAKELSILYQLLQEFKKASIPQNHDLESFTINSQDILINIEDIPIIIQNDGIVLSTSNISCDNENYNISDNENYISIQHNLEDNILAIEREKEKNEECDRMINFIESTCDIKKYNVEKIENVVSTNNSMSNLHNIIDQAEISINPIENNFKKNNMETTNNLEKNNMETTNNLEKNNMEITNEEKDEILDLSLKHHTDCFKKLKDFLPRPLTPRTKRKKIH